MYPNLVQLTPGEQEKQTLRAEFISELEEIFPPQKSQVPSKFMNNPDP